MLIDAETSDEVVNLVCVAIAIFVGVIGFAFTRGEASPPEALVGHSPRKQIGTQHLPLTRPELANAIDAMVNVLLIVFDACLVGPRVDAVVGSLLGALHKRQVPSVAILVSDIHPDAAKLKANGTEYLLLVKHIAHDKRGATVALYAVDCDLRALAVGFVERKVSLGLGFELFKCDISEEAVSEVSHYCADEICSVLGERVATPNDPKLRDRGGWRGSCEGGAKKEATDVKKRHERMREVRARIAASVTAVAVLCSALLAVTSFRLEFRGEGRGRQCRLAE